LFSHLEADLVWTQETGWQPTTDDVLRFNKESTKVLQLMSDARLAQDEGRMGTALSVYKHLCKHFPDTISASEAYYQTGIMKASKNQFNDAFNAFNIITKQHPEYPRFNDVLQEFLKLLDY
jgi:hypothetical protein